MTLLFTSLAELKALLDIPQDDLSRDLKLGFINEYAASRIESEIGRPDLTYRQRTQYLAGTGTQYLILKHRPIYTTPTPPRVWVDMDGAFGANSGAFDSTKELTYGDVTGDGVGGFCVKVDDDSGTKGKSGLLMKIGGTWEKGSYRTRGLISSFLDKAPGTIKVVYYAGYTSDDLPGELRWAGNIMCARMNNLLPLGIQLGGESYEERSISMVNENIDFLLGGGVASILARFKNKNW